MDKQTLKTLCLVSGIIYTLLLVGMFFLGSAKGDTELMLGCAMFFPPVMLNWFTWAELKK